MPRFFSARFFSARVVLSLFCCCTAVHAGERSPRLLFTMECQGCHLQDGQGGVNAVPPLKDQVARFLQVPGGREFLAQVPGVARSPLNDQQITAVLNWMLLEFGPQEIVQQHPPYTVDEISQLRRTPLVEVSEQRARLVQQFLP